MTTDKTKWSYAAAMVDGEGHISINEHKVKTPKGKDYWLIDCKIGVSNTSIPLMKWLVENFGGKFYDGKQGCNRICYRWFLDGYEKMELFLLGILPYMVIKREQAAIALEFVRMRGKKNPAKRLEMAIQCRALNKGLAPETNTSNDPDSGLKIESELHSNMQSGPVVTLDSVADSALSA